MSLGGVVVGVGVVVERVLVLSVVVDGLVSVTPSVIVVISSVVEIVSDFVVGSSVVVG